MANSHNRTKIAAALLLATTLAACGGSKESKPGQSLARVNGEEITVSQLNEELQRANVQTAQQEAASKQLLESLIDRQLLVNQATQDKLDRDPKVLQAIERAKALLLAQAYLQKKVGAPVRPTKAEIEEYFNQHPEFFSNRKQFDMRQLVMATKDIEAPLKAQIDNAKSLDEVSAWMDQNKVKYTRAQVSRTSADLPQELSKRLLDMPKGQLFIVKEGERSLLITVSDIKESPVRLDAAAGQIEQFLFNKKNKDAADAELARLRANAKIEYLNGRTPPEKAAPAAPAAAASAPAAAPAAPAAAGAEGGATDAQNARGVAGLK
ncbi:peptidyl-prolyl cis-trans isomerase, EpsD family [Duganella sp. CY15W]|uniref:EpsD family peptidyl-prolyl cis-trans isomerase n=1 Tax=Duganella sp. CY15W TaxID=2692172 RepID=UPI00136AA106|nr:EpsD family peptidyl-prolyl cis-trans isomerase [Duganella sp. CY15W]MYM32519.1 peptidyl-prolyl cis-trans isomerase, EpsD family [Duganella sp. CY15W]